jgi:hypothetical protein
LSTYPKIKLSEIRRIGWRDWDPIGLSDGSEFGPEYCAGEYDRYLLHVVSMITRGGSRADAVTYLCEIANDHMGLSEIDSEAAQRTVDEIAKYLNALPDSPPIRSIEFGSELPRL